MNCYFRYTELENIFLAHSANRISVPYPEQSLSGSSSSNNSILINASDWADVWMDFSRLLLFRPSPRHRNRVSPLGTHSQLFFCLTCFFFFSLLSSQTDAAGYIFFVPFSFVEPLPFMPRTHNDGAWRKAYRSQPPVTEAMKSRS